MLTIDEMISAIKNNYPDSKRYSMLCEALDHALELFEAEKQNRLLILKNPGSILDNSLEDILRTTAKIRRG